MSANNVALYKAMRKDNNEWIEGCLVMFDDGTLCPGQAFILPFINSMLYGEKNRTIGGFIEVVPETICRFTGLYDKAKNRIFEKDIVKNHMGFRQVVQWYMGTFVFRSELDYIYNEWQGETFCACSKRFEDATACVTADEVVGTIFDDEEYLMYLKEAKEEDEK